MDTPREKPDAWWSRRLPAWVDTSVWGLFFSSALAIAFAGWLIPLLLAGHKAWYWAACLTIFGVAQVTYVWFFTPVYLLLDAELPRPETGSSPRRLHQDRFVASGLFLIWLLPAALYPSIFVAWAIGTTITGDVQPVAWLFVLGSFAAFAWIGTQYRSSLQSAMRLWARRLGRTVDPPEPDHISTASPHRLAGAFSGMLVLLLLTAPTAVEAGLGAYRERSKYGLQRWLSEGEAVRLWSGVVFRVPSGMGPAMVTTNDPHDIRFGIVQRAILQDDSSDEGSIQFSVFEQAAVVRMYDPARLAESARSRQGSAVFGPQPISYRGWKGTAVVADDYLARPEIRYRLWLRLEDEAGRELFISADTAAFHVGDVVSPVEAAKTLIDYLELQPATSD